LWVAVSMNEISLPAVRPADGHGRASESESFR
jgi:hypothetical protein